MKKKEWVRDERSRIGREKERDQGKEKKSNREREQESKTIRENKKIKRYEWVEREIEI